MKKPIIAAAMFLAFIQPGYADACKDKFVAFMMGLLKNTPGVARITEQAQGKVKESAFVYLARDHYMYRPVKPDKGMWVMAWKTGRYSSSNKGKDWKKIGPVNAAKEQAYAEIQVNRQAKTATNLSCAEETIDGIVHDVYKADIAVTAGAKSRSRNTYWVSRKNGMAVKSIYATGQKGKERVTTQYWKPAGNTTLPKPE